MRAIIMALIFILIGAAVGSVLAVGVGATMGAATGLMMGAQTGVCLAAEAAGSQERLSKPEVDAVISEAIGKLRSKSRQIQAKGDLQWVEGTEGCAKLLARFAQETK